MILSWEGPPEIIEPSCCSHQGAEWLTCVNHRVRTSSEILLGVGPCEGTVPHPGGNRLEEEVVRLVTPCRGMKVLFRTKSFPVPVVPVGVCLVLC